MTSISHALIGAAIASRVHDPVSAGAIAFATHFLCDMIPHWDLGTNWRLRPKAVTGALAVGETLIAVFGTYFLFASIIAEHFTLIVAIVASLIPDWSEAPYYLLMPHSPKVFYYLYKIQSYLHERLAAPWGVVTQAATVGAFLVVGFVMK